MAGKIFKSNIDLDHNQLVSAALENSSIPSNPVAGQIYYDTDDYEVKYYNGNTISWISLVNTTTSGKNIVGATDTATADGIATDGNVYLNHVEDGSATSAHNITGSAHIAVTASASGDITITHSDAAGYKHIPTGGSTGEILTNNGSGSVGWASAPSGTTNLSIGETTSTTVRIDSSTGTNATLVAANTDDAGLMTAALWDKLDGIAAGAEVNVDTDLAIGTRTTTTMPITNTNGDGITLLAASTTYAGLMTKSDFDKLAAIEASANNYSHPTTYDGDDIDADTTALTGATVISDLDFNITTDTMGHVTDATLTTLATRDLTASDVGAAPTGHDHGTGTTGSLTKWSDTSGNLEDALTIQTTVRADGVAADTAAVTEAAVRTAINDVLAANDAMVYKGTLGTGGDYTSLPTTHSAGWTLRVITAGTWAGETAEVGDMVVALVDRAGSGNVDADWQVIQANIDGAVIGPASATNNSIAVFDLTTGKLIKDGGSTIADLATDLSVGTVTATNVPINSSTGNNIATLPAATATLAGIITNGAQTFGGTKTFNSTISADISGNAATVTNATLTTALTVNTGTVTLTGNVANSSVLTLGAGASSVSGSNTGDQNAAGVSIADGGSIITATTVEGALQENRTAIDLNTDKVTNATHTGDVSDSSGELTIINGAVTNAKAADMAAYTIKGNDTASAGDPKDLTITELRFFAATYGFAMKQVVNTSGTTNPQVIAHDLNSIDLTVSIKEAATKHIVEADVVITDADEISIEFGTDPTDAQYVVTIIG